MRLPALVLLALAFPSFAGSSEGPQDKRPVPEDASLKDADKTVRELFKDDYAKKTPADKRALAKKLLAQGREPANPPPVHYAALMQAADLAAQTGDADTCSSALTDLFKGFQVDVVAQRTPVLATLSKNVKTPDEVKGVSKAYLALADDAASVDRFDDAAKAAEAAVAQAKRSKDVATTFAAEMKGRSLSAQKARYEKIKKFKETLVAMPDDPAANAAVGQYVCVVKEDWAAGIPMLAKGTDGPLKSAALLDSANPQSPGDRLAAGNAWWDLAEFSPVEDRVAVRARAGHWYLQCQTKLTGLDRAKVDKRLNLCCVDRLARGNWIDVNDPGVFGQPGKTGEPIEVAIADGGRPVFLNSKSLPAGEYDGLQIRVRFKGKCESMISFNGPGYQRPVALGFKTTEGKLYLPGDTWPTGFIYVGPLPVMDEYLIQVIHENGKETCWFNGEEQRHWPNSNNFFDQISLTTSVGTVVYDKIRVRKR